MYTICYALVDNQELFYYNQLLISISSIRRHMKDVRIYVLMDEMTNRILLEKNREEFNNFGLIESIVIKVSDEYTQKQKSRFIKLNVRKLVRGNILYLDTDTIISRSLPSDISDASVALVKDFNISLYDRLDYANLEHVVSEYGYCLKVDEPYYNGGVIWSKDDDVGNLFYDKWLYEWEKHRKMGKLFDQPPLYFVNKEMGYVISELDDRMNVQITASPFPINYLQEAYIIHYLNVVKESCYKLSEKGYQDKGYNSDEIRKIINNPLSSFNKCRLIRVDDESNKLYNSLQFRLIKKIANTPIFGINERILKFIFRKKY